MIRRSAAIPATDPRHAGPLFVNPGGPGGSGVSLVLGAGAALQTLVDSPEVQDDIVSFDPRGVGKSTAVETCFPDSKTLFSWFARVSDQGVLGGSDRVLANLWGLVKARDQTCNQHNPESIRRHVTTPAVARDMLAILDKQHEWYNRKPRERVTYGSGIHGSTRKPLLHYWGFSYGTLLGATFASLFPNRTGRVVLDGVVGFSNYYNLEWTRNLRATEKAMNYFYSNCAAAGPDKCALAQSGTNAADVRAQVKNFLGLLQQQPMSISDPSVPTIITWSDLKSLIFSSPVQSPKLP